MKTTQTSVLDLVADPANVRTHDAKNIEAIKGSLARFGQQKPIVVNAAGVVVAGNGTLAAALDLGWKQVATVCTELVGAEATAYAIADNRTAELAAWDDDALAKQLASFQITDEELAAATGFDAKAIEELVGKPEVVEDEVPEPPVDPVTQPGDLILLGEHRLLCGDSTNADDVARLMDGQRADLCFTSPPYNLGDSSKLSGNKSQEERGCAYTTHNDNTSPEQWRNMVDLMIGCALDHCSAAVFNVQPLAGNKRVIWNWIAGLSDRICDVLVWDKQHAPPQMAAGVLTSQYELLVVVGDIGASRAVPFSTWHGNISTVYSAPPQRNNDFAGIHGATFPVHLPAFVVGTLCNKSQSVYDCCMGSGTTLIACEQLGRKCYGMEIDPAYCDVIVQRWENLTGKKAERHG